MPANLHSIITNLVRNNQGIFSIIIVYDIRSLVVIINPILLFSAVLLNHLEPQYIFRSPKNQLKQVIVPLKIEVYSCFIIQKEYNFHIKTAQTGVFH